MRRQILKMVVFYEMPSVQSCPASEARVGSLWKWEEAKALVGKEQRQMISPDS